VPYQLYSFQLRPHIVISYHYLAELGLGNMGGANIFRSKRGATTFFEEEIFVLISIGGLGLFSVEKKRAKTFFLEKMGGHRLAVQNPQMNDCSAAEDNNNINNNTNNNNGSSEVVGTSPNWDWVIRDSL
jgi:hypothetical protein